MKFQQIILSMSFLLLLLPLLVVESSSFNDSNITANGTSSLSTFLNDSSFSGNIITSNSSISIFGDISSTYWPSSSGNFGFGFYQIACPGSSPHCPEKFVVGISFLKSPSVPMVWTTNRYYYKPSSILLTDEGKFVVRMKPDDEEEPLIPNIQEPVAYAVMHENGNFVLYGLHSQIVWQSFDYPTYTILGGQKLRSGVDLVAGGSRLSVQEINGSVEIYTQSSESVHVSVISDALEGSLKRPIFLTLNTTGDLYLVGSDGVLLKYLYRNKKHQGEDDYVYRATLYSNGYFDLYKERVDGNDHAKSSILVQSWPIHHMSTREKCLIAVKAFFGFVGLCFLLAICYSVVKAVWARLNPSPVS